MTPIPITIQTCSTIQHPDMGECITLSASVSSLLTTIHTINLIVPLNILSDNRDTMKDTLASALTSMLEKGMMEEAQADGRPH